MPKRIPTPPPSDDEPRYLTVVHPYATSGTCNMELPKDREDFARWVACCIDKDAFFAIFHKPSSRDMVIIEVNRDYAHIDRILGEHRWSEFLQTPTKEEVGRVTQVFYCTYHTGRLVQKNGWKRIDVDEAWFKAWSPRNKYIKFPYPPTRFCDVPVEDRTNHSMCRPLPGAVKIPPPVVDAPQPVVGSVEWIQTKGGEPSTTPSTAQTKSNTLGAWGKGAPNVQPASAKLNPTANGSAKMTVDTLQGPHSGTKTPAVGGGSVVVKSSNVWQNKGRKSASTPVVTNWDDSAPVSRQSTPVSPSDARGSSATSYPTQPPGLPLPSKAAASVVRAQGGPDRAVNLSATSWGSAGASISSPDSDSGPDPTTATESDNPHNVYIHLAESMEEEFHGMGIKFTEDDDGLRELDSIAPGNWDDPTGPAIWEPTAAWDDDALDADDHWKRIQPQPAKELELCNAHGIICRKGICVEYAKQVRLKKRAEEAEERKAAAANKGKKSGRAKARAVSKKDDENESFVKNKTQNNAFRGPGAPVKTNWRGAPRALVSADTIEKRETTKDDASEDGWGNSDPEIEPSATAVVPDGSKDVRSDASWDVSEDAFHPWAASAQPVAKAKGSGGKPASKKKPAPTKVSTNWADHPDAELAAAAADDDDDDGDSFSAVSSKRGSKRGTSTKSWTTSSAKTSTSGWGSVPAMQW